MSLRGEKMERVAHSPSKAAATESTSTWFAHSQWTERIAADVGETWSGTQELLSARCSWTSTAWT